MTQDAGEGLGIYPAGQGVSGEGVSQIVKPDTRQAGMEEIKKDPVWHDFFYTELTTGMRRGEICGLMDTGPAHRRR